MNPGTYDIPGNGTREAIAILVFTDADQTMMSQSEGEVLEIAHALNVAMHNDAAARARYLAIWGVEWMPIPAIGGADYFPTHDEIKACGASTTANTACGKLARGTK